MNGKSRECSLKMKEGMQSIGVLIRVKAESESKDIRRDLNLWKNTQRYKNRNWIKKIRRIHISLGSNNPSNHMKLLINLPHFNTNYPPSHNKNHSFSKNSSKRPNHPTHSFLVISKSHSQQNHNSFPRLVNQPHLFSSLNRNLLNHKSQSNNLKKYANSVKGKQKRYVGQMNVLIALTGNLIDFLFCMDNWCLSWFLFYGFLLGNW